MFFPMGLWFYYLGISKVMTKFKWHEFQIIRINRKKIGGSGITPSYFPALMKWSFLVLRPTFDCIILTEISNFSTFSLVKIITIGGCHGRIDENMGISSDVWYFMDPLKHNYEATLLNSLNEPRMQHSCGIMRKNKNEDKFIAVVAGGYNGFKSLDSVEILEFDKGSLIPESFLILAQISQKKGAKSLY